MSSLLVRGKQQSALRDNTTRVEISAPHSKCTAFEVR